MLCVVLLPVCTTLLHGAKVAIALQNLTFPLDELYTKTSRDVEWNMAVHLECYISTDLSGTMKCGPYQPCARIVRFERKDKISLRWKGSCVASNRVVHVQSRDVAVPDSVCLLGQDEEVVTVQMNGMRNRRRSYIVLLNDPVLPLYDVSSNHLFKDRKETYCMSIVTDFKNVVSLTPRLVACEAIEDSLQGRLIEVNQHGYIIDFPLNKIAAVEAASVSESEFELLRDLLRDGGLDVRNDDLVVAPSG